VSTVSSLSETPLRSEVTPNPWIVWLPLAVLPAIVCIFRPRLLPWQFMWLLSIVIFFGCKWQTWFAARTRASFLRNLGYLFFWPGMDAPAFLSNDITSTKPAAISWLGAFTKTAAGTVLLLIAARNVTRMPQLLVGWTAMLGLVLFLHFGTFHLLALLWQSAGVNAEPIMRSPLSSTSLSELWGKRWNIGFRELSHGLVFQPIRARWGVVPATMAAFFASGLIHDFVISFPARGGYGLPTAYFLLQGIGVLFERSRTGRSLGLGSGVRGWFFVLAIAGPPAFILFHPPFVMRVILPFVLAIRHALGIAG
jgi:Membrane bound O-acyl transferase family